MASFRKKGLLLTSCVPLFLAPVRLPAAFTFDDGRNQVFLSAEYGFQYDSNLFANREGGGDYSHTANLVAEFSRQAGMINVGGSVGVTSSRFDTFSSEDFDNPDFSVKFSRPRGRLTGSLGLSFGKENSPDEAANLRTELWNYQSTLDLKYPVNERYYFTAQTTYHTNQYGGNGGAFVDLNSWSQSADVFYVYTSKLDLFSGYRLRVSDTSDEVQRQDHAITFGATGSILPKLSGSIRAGYQFRRGTRGGAEDDGSLTGAFSLIWTVLSQLSFTGQLSKDYTITSTGTSVDATAFNLSGRYSANPKFGIAAGFGYTHTLHLGTQGGGRVDDLLSGNIGITRTLTSVVSSALSYRYTTSFSNASFAEYDRHTLSFNLSARF